MLLDMLHGIRDKIEEIQRDYVACDDNIELRDMLKRLTDIALLNANASIHLQEAIERTSGLVLVSRELVDSLRQSTAIDVGLAKQLSGDIPAAQVAEYLERTATMTRQLSDAAKPIQEALEETG